MRYNISLYSELDCKMAPTDGSVIVSPFLSLNNNFPLFSRCRYHAYPLLSCPMQFIGRLLSANEVMLNSFAAGSLAALPGSDRVNNCTVTTMVNCLISANQCFQKVQKKVTSFLTENKGTYTAWQADLLWKEMHLHFHSVCGQMPPVWKGQKSTSFKTSLSSHDLSLLTLSSSWNELSFTTWNAAPNKFSPQTTDI